jgi:hypothetical protein
MLAFHGDAAASITDVFHGHQFGFAHMGLVDFRFAAERAFLPIPAGIAKVPRILCHGTATFA